MNYASKGLQHTEREYRKDGQNKQVLCVVFDRRRLCRRYITGKKTGLKIQSESCPFFSTSDHLRCRSSYTFKCNTRQHMWKGKTVCSCLLPWQTLVNIHQCRLNSLKGIGMINFKQTLTQHVACHAPFPNSITGVGLNENAKCARRNILLIVICVLPLCRGSTLRSCTNTRFENSDFFFPLLGYRCSSAPIWPK